MKKQLAKLITVKTIMTLALVFGFVWGFVVKIVSTELYVPLVTAAVTFYFAKKD